MRKLSFSARHLFLLFLLVGVLSGGGFYAVFETQIVAALSSVTLNDGVAALPDGLDLESQADLGSDIGAYQWSVDPDGGGGQPEVNLMTLNMPFNSGGTQTDFSGASHTGTVSEAIVPADPGTVCKVGTCLDFDASNDYVSVSGTFGGTSEATVSAWVKVEANTGSFQSIVSPTDQNFIHLQVNYPNGDGNLAVYTNSTTILLPMITLSTGTWHHVAISAQSGSTKAYVDGAEVSSDASTFSTINSTTSLNIGRGFAGGRFFNGMIDEVQVYSRALTSQQISRLYSDGNAGVGSPTIIESEETVLEEAWDLSVTPITTAGSISSGVNSSNTVTIAPPYSVQLENGVYSGSPANELISTTEDLNSYVFYNGVSGFDVNTIGAYQWSVDPDGGGGQPEVNLMTLNMPFNSGGTQTDFSGEGNNGAAHNGAVYTSSGCQVGGCMSLDGVNDSVSATSAGNDFNFLTSDFTLSTWFKTSSSGVNGLFMTYGGTPTYFFRVSNGVPILFIRDVSGNTINISGGSGLNDGNWHHIAGVRNGTSAFIYVDGVEVATGSNGSLGSVNHGCSTLIVGAEASTNLCLSNGTENYFSGSLDEVQVSSQALSSAQIAQLYADGNAGLGGPTVIVSEETVLDEVWDLSVTPITTSGTIGSVITSANTIEIVSTNIQILDPNGGETIPAGSDYLITWSASDSLGVNTVDLEYTLNNLNYVSIDTNLPAENYYLFDSQFGSSGSANGQFTNSREIVIDSSGSIYVADQTNARVQKFDSNHNFVGWIGNCSAGTNCNVGAQVTTAFCSDCTPTGVGGSGDGQFTTSLQRLTVDSSGNIYVSESGQRRVQKFNSNGTFQLKWGTDGTANGQLSENNGVAVDAAGNVYVAEISAYRVQKFNSSGSFLGWFGSCSAGTNCNVGGGVTTALCTDCTVGVSGTGDGQFSSAQDLVVDSSGNIFVMESTRIQKFNSSGTFLAKWGSFGSGEGQFNSPLSIATDADNNVYVTDWQNKRFQKFDNNGVYLAQGGTNGTGDGQFTGLFGIAVSADGTVYANDWGGPVDRIQQFTPGGSYLWSVPFANSSQARIRSTVFGGDGSASDTSDAVFTIETNQVISGTCRQSDNITNCSDGATVRVAVNGVLLGGSDTTSTGTWSISAGGLNSDDVVAVFLDGVNETNEAAAITKYDGTGDVTGVELIESHLTIGSDDNASVTNADMALYDNSVSGDEDIFFEVDANNDFTVDFEGGHDVKLLIFVGNTYRPDSTSSGNVSTNDLQNDGTLIADGNTIFVSGDWVNTGTFTANTSTVDFSSTGTQSLISGGSSFATVTHSGSGTLQLSGALTVTSAFNNDDGTFYLNGFDWTMTGSTFSNDGILQIQGSETITGLVQDTGAGTALLTGDGPAGTSTFILEDAYFNLTIDADASETFEQSDDTVIANTLTITSGTYSQNGFSTQVNGANTLIIDGGTYEQGDDPLTVVGDLQVLNGGIFNGSNTGAAIDINGNVDLQVTADTVRLTTGTMTVAGDWTNSMATGFDNNNGTVQLDTSTVAAVNGSTVWYNLTINEPSTGKTLTFEAGEVQTFETGGTLSATGASGNLINFVSSDPGVTQWEITHTDENSGNLSYVSVTDGGCIASADLFVSDFTNGGNNDSCWALVVAPDAVDDLDAVVGYEEVTLSWSAPANNGSAITDYIVEYGETSGFPGNAQVFMDGVSATTGATVTSLVNGTEYSFRVAAVNGVGTGAYSNVATDTPSSLPMILNGDVNDEVTEDTDVISSFVGSPPATSTVGYQWLVDRDGVGAGPQENFMGVNVPMNSGATQIDISGNDVDMAVEGTAAFQTNDCQVGGCMSFDGTTSALIPTPGTSTITDAFTLEFWAKPTGTRLTTAEENANLVISGNFGQRYAVFPPQMGAVDAGVGVSVGTNGVSVFEHGDFHMPSLLVYDTPISDWTHVVVTYDFHRPKLYLNGVKVRTGIKSLRGTIYPGIKLGGILPGELFDQHLYGPYMGLLDEFKLYPMVITPQQILQNYNDGFAGNGGPTRILTQEHRVDEVWTLNVFELLDNGTLLDTAIPVDTVTIVPAPHETYVTVTTPANDRVPGNITVEYTCRNTGSVPRDILVEYYDSGLATWFPATVDSALFDIDATPVAGDVSENKVLAAPCSSTLPDGSSHSFDWDAVADGVGDVGGETVQIRITADTSQVGGSVLMATTGNFSIGGAFGKVYNDAGVTPIMDGGVNCPSPCTVGVSINGGAATNVNLDGNSEFSFPGLSYEDGDVLTFYLNDETADAVTVVKVTGAPLEELDLWRDRLILRQEGSVEITNSVLDIANNNADADITAVYTMSGTTVSNPSGKTLVIRTGTEYRPGALVTLSGGIDIDGTFTMEANTITVAQGWDAVGGTTTSTGTVTFNGSTTTINPNGQTFNNVSFGFNGTKTLAGDFTVNGNLVYTPTLNGATVVADGTPRTITLFGNFSTGGGSFNGTFGNANLTLRMEGGNAQTLSRASNQGVVFNLIVDKSSSTATLVSEFSMNAGSTFTLTSGTFNAGSFVFTVPGAFSVDGGTISANVVANIVAQSTYTQTNGTVEKMTFGGGNATLTQSGGTLTDVTFTNNGTKTLASDFTVNGNLIYSPTLAPALIQADASPRSIYLSGNFSTAGGFNGLFGDSNLTLVMTGTNAQTMSKATPGLAGSLEIDKASNSVTLLSAFPLGATGTFKLTSGTFNASSFVFTVPGTFTINGGTISANAVANIVAQSTYTQTNGSVEKMTFGGGNATLTQSGGTLTDVTFTNNGTKTLASDFTINGNLVYSPTLAPALIQADASPRSIFLSGNFSTAGGFNGIFGDSNLTVVMTGTNAQTLSKATPALAGHLEIDKASNSVTLLSTFPLGATGTFTLTSGTFNAAGFVFTVPGAFNVDGGTISANAVANVNAQSTYTQTNGTVEKMTFSGSGGSLSQTAGTLTDVTFANSTSKTIASDFVIDGDLVFAPAVNGGQVVADGISRSITVSGDFSTVGIRTATFGDANLTLIMSGTNAQTMSHATPPFSSHLEIDKSSNAVALSGTFTFPSGRNFTITDGTFDLNGNTWNMSGVTFSNTNNGTVQLRGSESITGLTQDINSGNWRYVGDGAAGTVTFTVKDFGATDYYNVTFAGDATETFQQGAATVIANTLQVTSGTYSQNGFATNVNGANTLIVDGGTYEQGGAPLMVEGDLQVLNNGIFNGSNTGAAIDVNGSVDLQSTANTVRLTTGTMTVEGDWTNAMTSGFDNNNGTVRLDTSSAAAVNGSTTWYNLVLEPAGKTVTFEAGEVQTFETGGDLSATGASGNLINFVSSAPGVTQWDITHTDENSGNLNYVSVIDGGCVNSDFLILTDSVDGGNNDACWYFGTVAVPNAVNDLDALAGDTQVSLTWSAPAGNGSVISDYIVEYGLTVGFPGNAQVFSDGTSATTGATVTGLTNYSEYSFRVSAVNAIGTGSYSNVDTATPVPPPEVPDAVNNLVATAMNGQVGLTWSAPANNGSAITDYIVEYGATSGFPGNVQVFNDGISSLTGATVTGLVNGTEYSFRVAAVNGVGTGPYSNVDTATPAAGSAPEPTDEFDISVDLNDFLSFSISNLAVGNEPAGDQPFGAGDQITDLTSTSTNDYAISGAFGSPVYTMLEASTNSNDGYSVIAYASNLDGRMNTLLRSGGAAGNAADEIVDSLVRLPASQAANTALVLVSATGIAFRLMDANTDISLRGSDEDTQWGDGDAGTALWASFPLGSGAAQVIYDTANFSGVPTIAFINWFVGIASQQQSGSYAGQVTFTASVN